MEIHLVTILPNYFTGPLTESILRRAQSKGIVRFYIHDVRAYATDKHRQVDDYPYGGGAGMILKPEPLFRCLDDVVEKHGLHDIPVTLLSPAGEAFQQKKAVQISLREKLILLCGHYKAIDERVIERYVGEEISIGDYVVTAGELAALCVVDAVVRLLPGAIGDIDSAETDSFQAGLLDCPYYTRPEEFRGHKVPKELLSGNHAEVSKWRLANSLERTRQRRPDLYEKYIQSELE